MKQGFSLYEVNITSSTPLFITYNGFGDGHYNYAFYRGEFPREWSTKIMKGCSCGVNSKVHTQSCANSKAYQSRCKCLKARKKCTSACRCKNCGNPNGQRVIPPRKRQRHAHDWQTKLPTQESFVMEKGVA